MNFNWFLPYLRRRRKNETSKPPTTSAKAARAILPETFFSNRERGRPGKVRQWLKWLGPTVLSSPFRRLSQAVCFLLFLALFFYVCWPYDAKPLPPPEVSESWLLDRIDQEAGTFHFSNVPEVDAGWLTNGAEVHVEDAGAKAFENGYVAVFMVNRFQDGQLELSLKENADAPGLDRLLSSPGPWRLYSRDPSAWPTHYADSLAAKEKVPADFFLTIDPLLSISTAVASRNWVWSLVCAGIILAVCVFIPRGFCGYLCPLGTLIDFFDWAVGKRVKRFQTKGDGWWVHIKYYLLAGVMVAALCGVLVSGFVAAIPVVTRGMLFVFEPIQAGMLRGWHQVPPITGGQVVSILLFLGVLCLGFLRPRFWCKYVCPSGAVFSLGNLFRATERKVESSCINCNKCVEVCPFDAIKPDFTTRVTDCTLCQTCGGVCPSYSIKFVDTLELQGPERNQQPAHP